MSSQVEQAEFIEGLREDGTLDALNRSLGRAEAPVEETETVEEPAEEEAPAEETVDEEPDQTPEVEEVEEDLEPEGSHEADEEDEEYTLDVTPEVQAYLEKYGGDLTEALKAAANAQSLIGRQGNELGDVRRELDELRQRFEQPQYEQVQQPYQTYLPDPDEADEQEMAAAYASLAHEAVQRSDAETLQRSIEAWKDVDPFGASVFVGQLQAQVYEERLRALQTDRQPGELAAEMDKLKEKYPDISGRVQEIGEEAMRWPTLGYVLQEGSTPERVQALETLYLQVANRATSETSQQALRRVAVRTSEEARKARQQAQVAGAGRGPVADPETPSQRIPLGKTGRSVDLNRVDEILQSGRI